MNKIESQFQPLFQKQRENQYKVGNTTYKERVRKLTALQKALEITFRDEIRKALYDDFKKPALEVDLTEIYTVVSDIKYTKKHLRSWMKDKKAGTPMVLLGSSSRIHYEPKGVCLIISPWNFPVNLTFSPLVSAIAAGNTAIIKPSEITPNSSRIIAKIIRSLFGEDEVAVVEGGVEASTALLQLPFNHIFFTGSPAVGKIVMEAATKNLTSVTLELGGKSPTIIDETADLKVAARRIAWGKFLNNGQICVSPDYILIQESVKTVFIARFKEEVQDFYTENPKSSPDYSRIVSDKQFRRIADYIDDAKELQATIEMGGEYDAAERYIEPTIISNLPKEARILNEEIFGPVLPVVTFKTKQQVVDYINNRPRPLALYIYSRNKKNIEYFLRNTRAGSSAVNQNILQYINHDLPFGGVNNSGIGKSHGFYGFKEFSNERSVLKQKVLGPIETLLPPYDNFKQKIANLAIRWF